MTYKIETKDYVHIPEHSFYNHNYYRNIYTGEVILKEYGEDDELITTWEPIQHSHVKI